MGNARDIFEGRVATFAPGHGDLFLVTMIGDQIVYNEPVASYDAAVWRAEAVVARLRWRRPFTVKVLPLSGPEARALGLLPATCSLTRRRARFTRCGRPRVPTA